MPLLGGCCSLDLKIGTKIIGIIFLILNLLCFLGVAFLLVVFLVMKEMIYQMLDDAITASNEIMLDSSNDGDYRDVEDRKSNQLLELIQQHRDLVMIVFIVILGQQLIDITCSSLLIHAVRKNRRGLLLPWIVTHTLYNIIDLAILVLLVTVMISVTGIYQIVLPIAAVQILFMALHIYFVLVVISQYQALGLIRMHDEMCMK